MRRVMTKEAWMKKVKENKEREERLHGPGWNKWQGPSAPTKKDKVGG